MNSRNTTKMVEHKLILLATVRNLWTLVTLLIKLFRILLKFKCIQDQNYTILAAIWWKRSYFVENVSSRSPGWTVFIWENFHPGYRDLGRKNRDLGNRASPVPHMNTSIFLQRKEWRGEISETEPTRLTGLIWRGSKILKKVTKWWRSQRMAPIELFISFFLFKNKTLMKYLRGEK